MFTKSGFLYYRSTIRESRGGFYLRESNVVEADRNGDMLSGFDLRDGSCLVDNKKGIISSHGRGGEEETWEKKKKIKKSEGERGGSVETRHILSATPSASVCSLNS